MQEIEFKAWDKESKEMFRVILLQWESVERQQLKIVSGRGGSTTAEDCILVQYTGFKDKNDKKIHNGDILMFPDTESEFVDVGIGDVKVAETPINAFFPVEYVPGEFGMNIRGTEHGIDGWISLRAFGEDYYPLNDCEVIGNIYENPELIKKDPK